METYKIKAFSELINVPVRTLSAWSKSGKLVPLVGEEGKKFYTEDHLAYCKNHDLDLSSTKIRAFRTEVDLNESQWELFRRNLCIMRFVYNLFIDANTRNRKEGKPYQNAFDFSKWLNNDYLSANPDKIWIKEASSKAVKQVIINADQAFRKYRENVSNFAERLAKGQKVKRDADGKPKWPEPPRFKKKFVDEPSYYFIGEPVRIERHRIKIPLLGWVHLKEKGYLPVGRKVVSGNLKIHNNRVFVSVRARGPKVLNTEASENPGIGVDLGVKNLAICSDGRVFPNINNTKRVKHLEKLLKRVNRSITRKKNNLEKQLEQYKNDLKTNPKLERPQSNNLIRSFAKRQRIYAELEAIRTDHVNKCVKALVRTKPCYVTLEDLNVSGMMKNRHLAKAIAAQKLCEMKTKLINKCRELGIEVRLVSRWYPSSKTCHECGCVKTDIKLSERTYRCPECGHVADRDLNAALNLRDAKEFALAG